MVFVKIVVFIISLALGLFFLIKTEPIVRFVGKADWAERIVPGGAYTLWKIIGLIVIILGFLFMMGALDWLIFPK